MIANWLTSQSQSPGRSWRRGKCQAGSQARQISSTPDHTTAAGEVAPPVVSASAPHASPATVVDFQRGFAFDSIRKPQSSKISTSTSCRSKNSASLGDGRRQANVVNRISRFYHPTAGVLIDGIDAATGCSRPRECRWYVLSQDTPLPTPPFITSASGAGEWCEYDESISAGRIFLFITPSARADSLPLHPRSRRAEGDTVVGERGVIRPRAAQRPESLARVCRQPAHPSSWTPTKTSAVT